MRNVLFAICSLLFMTLQGAPAPAEVKVLEAESTYLMGDQDSKIDGRRIAVQEAKRTALELAGTYVEGLTEVKNFQLTRDEVKSYTAGIVEAEVVAERMHGTPARPEITVKVRCSVDTDVLAARIGRYRENEDFKEQLDAAVRENDALKKERDTLVKQLGAERDQAKAEKLRKKLDSVLSREEADDDTKKAWIALGSSFSVLDEKGRDLKPAEIEKAMVTLQKAVTVNPQNLRAHILLASLYRKKGDAKPAEDQLQAAIEHHPSSPLPRLMLGLLLREQNRPQEALRELHFVERLRPHHPVMLFHTGMTLKQLGRCGASVRYLNKFLKDPRSERYPEYRDAALTTTEECGEDRAGRKKPPRQN